MKRIYTFLSIIIIFFSTGTLSAQQLFKDSGQSLGDNNSFCVNLGDLDGDGDLDAAVANPTTFMRQDMIYQTNEIWLNDGTGFFSKKTQQLGSSSKLTLFDIDSDGDLDLIEDGVSSFRGTNDSYDSSPIQTWLNDGKANFTLSDNYRFEGISIVLDKIVNSNDQYRAVTIESSGNNTILRTYLIDKSTCKPEKEIILKDFIGRGMAIGDLNGDGYSDLVVYRAESNYILFNDKKGGFIKNDMELTGIYHTVSVLLHDLNGDGFLDILQVNYHSVPPAPVKIFPVKLYLNNGNGYFTEGTLFYNSSLLATSVTIADMNNDGYPDIYINHGNQIAGNVNLSEILINDGHAKFALLPALEKVQSVSVAFGDLDNDGDLDMFLACAAVVGSFAANRVWMNTTIAGSSSPF